MTYFILILCQQNQYLELALYTDLFILIKIKKKNVDCIAHRERHKTFEETENFVNIIKEDRISKTTIIFKINIVKLIDKYPKLKK